MRHCSIASRTRRSHEVMLSPMAALLYIDALGLKALWKEKGQQAVSRSLSRFRSRLRSALDDASPRSVIEGGVQSDAAAILFDDPIEAVTVGIRLYLSVFMQDVPDEQHRPRLWLRGVIASSARSAGDHPLMNPLTRELRVPGWKQVRVLLQSNELFAAISQEQSGFRGMRLLIENALVGAAMTDALRLRVGERPLYRTRRLTHSQYPTRLKNSQDVLWMLTDDPAEWAGRQEQMTRLLRHAARNPEEFVQAASTSLVFTEADAILRDLTSTRPVRTARTRGRGRSARARVD
jgi:hypothetical protein